MMEICNLYASYSKGKDVLNDLSLSLNSSQIVVLLGENGVGKTTLFRCILGQVKPKSGTILLNGKSIASMKRNDVAKAIAYVPQQIELPSLSVYDCVLLGRLPHFGLAPRKLDHEIVRETLNELGLEEWCERNANELSGGEKQRVVIARAIAQEPSLILFDEPTSNLDLANSLLFLNLATDLAKRKGIASLCSLHDLHFASLLGDRFYFMKNGTILSDGDRSSIQEDIVKKVYGIDAKLIRTENEIFLSYGGTKNE